MPPEARQTLESAIRKVVVSKEYTEFLVNEYGIKGYAGSNADFAKFIDRGFVSMREMIKTYDIKN
jgi:tripartite-type tricarboxylate transporter receptor subunit TctC